jgi:hypothetical protein
MLDTDGVGLVVACDGRAPLRPVAVTARAAL